MMRKISINCARLSRLQRLILVMLCEPGLAVCKRRVFRRVAAQLYWDEEKRWDKKKRASVAASLSRAMRNLEERQCIRPSDGRWTLSDSNPDDPSLTGVSLALLAWARDRESYARLGLYGPAHAALGIKPEPPTRPGIRVELDCD